MAKKKVTDLTEKTTLHKDDLFYIVDSEVSTSKGKKVKYGTIRPYKVYSALISKSGSNIITAKILKNELGGSVTYTQGGAGANKASLPSAFTENKTFIFLNSKFYSNDGALCTVEASWGTVDEILITSFQIVGSTGINFDFADLAFEIRVYN